MRGHRVYGLLVAVWLMAAGGDAYAATTVIDCTNHAALSNEFTTTHPGGLAGTTYEIVNGPCTGSITITQNNISIRGQSSPQTIGGLLILGAQNLVLGYLNIVGGVCHDPPICFEYDGVLVRGGAGVGPEGADVTGMSGVTIEGKASCDACVTGGLRVEGASNVTGDSIIIQTEGIFGVFADNASKVALYGATIQDGGYEAVSANGGASVEVGGTISGFGGFGLAARGGSSVSFSGTLSKGSAGNTPTIAAFDSSSVTIYQFPGLSTSVAGPDNAPTILANGHSSIFIYSGSVTSSSASTAGPAIIAAHSSTLYLYGTNGAGTNPGSVTGPSNNHTILVSHGSSAFINDATITADTPFNASNQFAVIAAVHNASVTLAGSNTITNNAAGGLAVLLSAGSTLEENNGTSPDDYNEGALGSVRRVKPGNDTITGDGRIHTQSVIELGALPGPYTLTWDGNILLSQASSFRADGDNVTINGTITLDEASNGYFNHFAGTSNVISSVVCKSATDHVSNPNFVTPPLTSGPPPGCALF